MLFLAINCLLISTSCYSQILLKDHLESIIEDISVNNPVNSIDWENMIILLEELAQNPYDLNTVTRQQLEVLPFLSDIQIEKLLTYVYLHGPLQSVYELQLIPEFDRKVLFWLEPFVCVNPVDKPCSFRAKDVFRYGKHELVTRMDLPFYSRQGYKTAYLGPSSYLSGKYNFNFQNNIFFGLVGEKDAGEPFGALHAKKGFDYYSYYLLISDLGRIRKLAVGKYRLGFGKGLVINTNFSLGKSAYMGVLDFRNSGIQKHSSMNEYDYFRGAAAELKLTSTTDLALFYSHRNLDGTLNEDGTIRSVYKTGLHRSVSEAEKMNQFSMQLAGGHATYRKGRLQLGLTGIYYFFNRSYEPEKQSYSQFDMHGNHFYNVGLDYHYRWRNWAFQGEVATSKKGWATLNEVQYSLNQEYLFTLIHRYYATDYWNWFARSFSEGSRPQNENGWFFSAELKPWKDWRFFTYIDCFSFPWRKYRISRPSWGNDILFQTDYTPSEKYTVSAYYRFKRKERDRTGESTLTDPTWQHRFRLRISCLPAEWIELKTMGYYTRFSVKNFSNSNGYYVGEQLNFQIPEFPLRWNVQVGYFQTDDYDSRVYASERGLLYTFYTPSFQGKGMRCSAQLRYELNKHFLFLLKYGETLYFDRSVIGSGNDAIASSHKGDMQMQLRIKF